MVTVIDGLSFLPSCLFNEFRKKMYILLPGYQRNDMLKLSRLLGGGFCFVFSGNFCS